MSKPFAVAQINVPTYNGGGVELRNVTVRKSRASGCVAQFHALGWRPMGFRTIEAAKTKIERHPGFVAWA